jgi:DNA-binding CsgD family transcriptional regulator
LLLGEIELRAGATATARCALLDAAYQLTGGDRYLAVSALLLAGEALCRSGYHERFAGIARQALELRRGDEPPAAQFLFEHFTGLAAMFAGDQVSAVRPLRRVITLAGQLDEPVPLVRASLAGIVLGDDLEAHRLATRAVRLARATGERAALPQALEYVAIADFALGNYDAASASALDGMRLAREYGQDAVGADQLALLAVLAGMVGDWPTCAARARRAQASPSLDEAGQGWALSEWALSLLDIAEGRVRQATDRLLGLAGTDSGRGHPIIQMAVTPHLVEAAARCGDRRAARTAAKAFDGWARSTGNPTWLALSARSQALVAEHEDEAEEYFHEALRQHRCGDAPFLRARTEQMYGQELRRRRRPAAARQYFRNALETFQRFDATWWIDQVAAELRAAGDQVNAARRSVDAEALTAQQMQIARMVADGATNREVAAQLFLSPRTVDHHMRNIFARLGIRSRTELVKLMA